MQKFLRTLTLLALLCVPWVTQAQSSLTVYEDATSSNGYVPVYGFYADAYLKAHFVYPADVLSDLGTSATISQLTFYATEASVSWGNASFNVYLASANDATISAFAATEDMTLVYSGSLAIADNQMVVELADPFTYTGGNLLVAVECTAQGSYVTSTWVGAEVTGASVQGYNYSSLEGVTPTQRNFLPKVTIDYTGAGGNVCARPATLTVSDITGYTASVAWTSDVNDYILEYKKASDEEWTSVSLTTNSYALTSLDPSTAYNVRVKAVCSPGSESSYRSGTFTTLEVCPEGMVCVGAGEATNSTLPTYTFYNYSLTQQIYTAAELGSAASILSADFFCSGSITRNLDIYLVSTTKSAFESTTDWVAVTAADLVFSGEVTFAANGWTTIEFDNPFVYDGLSNVVLVVDDNTGAYVSSPSFRVFDATSASLRVYNDGTNFDPTAPSSYSGTVMNVKNRVRFAMGEPPACPKPTALTVNYTGGTSATVSWTSEAASFALDVNGTVTYNVPNPTTITGLDLATTYNIMVQADCGEDGTSEWTNPVSFTTDFCMPTDQCDLTFVLTDAWGDGWNGAYIEVIDVATTSTYAQLANENLNGTTGSGENEENTLTLPVCQGRTLQFVWHSGNYDNEASYTVTDINEEVIFEGTGAMSEAVSYTVNCTPSACRRPVAFSVVDAGPNYADLTWTERGEATSWIVAYKTDTDEDFTEVTVTTTNYRLAGLANETSYTVKVRSVCDEEIKWTNEAYFTTLEACPVLDQVTVTTVENNATISWHGYNDSYNLRYRQPSGVVQGFEAGLAGWTTIDADGDGYNWDLGSVIMGGGFNAHSGTDLACSQSYDNGALTPDNYLVSPQITLGGSISFWVAAQDASWSAEHFGVAVSTTGNTSASDFTTIQEWTYGGGSETPAKIMADWVQYTVDLSQYTGQGYVAIRHFNCTDQFYLDIDDIIITEPNPVENPWDTITTTSTEVELTDLDYATVYEYELQGICEGVAYDWSATSTFTTPVYCPTPVFASDAIAHVDGHSATLVWNSAEEHNRYYFAYRTKAYVDGISESFTGSTKPADWLSMSGLLSNVMSGTALSTTSQWAFGNSNGVFDQHARINIYGSSRYGWLISPAVEVNANTGFNFDLSLTAYSGTLGAPATTGTDDKFVVLVTTDDMATWTILRQWDNAGSEYVYNDIASSATGENVSIDLSAYEGQTVRVAFYGESTASNADNNLHLDNVYLGVSIPAGQWDGYVVTDTIITLTDLTPETLYEAGLQGVCAGNTLSPESELLTFSTTESCPAPDAVTVSDATPASITVEWTDSHNLEASYTLYNMEDTSVIATGLTEMSYTVEGLVANTPYTFGVKTDCSEEEASDFAIVNGRTACAALVELPYTNSFEADEIMGTAYAESLPWCWSRINDATNSYTYYPYSYTTYPRTGARQLYFYAGTTAAYANVMIAVMPQIDVVALPLSTLRLRFYTRGNYSGVGGDLVIGVMTDPADTNTFTAVQTIAVSGSDYVQNTVTGFPDNGAQYIAFRVNKTAATQYVYIDDLTLDVMPTCLEITDLVVSDATASSLTLSWNDTLNTGATYTVYNGQELVATGIAATNYTVTGLDAMTEYTFSVVANCSANDASYPISVSGRTACVAFETLPYSENFDTYEGAATGTTAPTGYPEVNMPLCWDILNLSANSSSYPQAFLTSSTSYAVSGNALFFKSSSTTPLYAVMPEFDVEGALQLLFTYRNEGTTASNGTILVGVMSNASDASTFVAIDSCERTSALTEKEVIISNGLLANGARIAFCYRGGTANNYYASIDDVTLQTAPSCVVVTGLVADDITADGATLTWTDANNTGATYTVYSLPDSSIVAANVATTSYTLTGLNANTQYSFAVQANCGSENAAWASVTFRTACGITAVPYVCNFDDMTSGVTPACWEKPTTGSALVNTSATQAYSGTLYLRFSGVAGNNVIVLPVFEQEANTLQLRFMTRPESVSNANCGTFSVGYLTDVTDATTFVALETYAYNDWTEDAYEEKTVSMATAPAGARMAFRHDAVSGSWYWFVDDVNVESTGGDTPGDNDSITVFDGENSDGYVPVYGFYADAYLRSQTIYPADNLSDMAGNVINGLTYYALQENVNWGNANFEVKLAEVSATTLTTFEDMTNAITVYTGPLAIVDSLMVVPFTTPYVYGGGNLLIEVNNLTTGTYVASTWRGTTVEGASLQGYSYSSWESISGTQRNFIPKTTFDYTAGSGDICYAVTGLTATDVTTNGATLSWADDRNTGATYTVYNGENVVATGLASTNYILTDLTPATTYTYTVVTNCSETSASFAASTTFTTQTFCPNGTCDVYIYAQDSYGDGWNGNTINVLQNGNVAESYSLADGNSDTATVSVCAGEPVSFSWTAGMYAYEASFGIANSNGNVMFAGNGSDMTTDSVFYTMSSCAEMPVFDTINIADTVCDVYYFNGESYTESGLYTVETLDTNGHHINIINLTVNNSVVDTLNVTAQNSYTWDTVTYTLSGVYTNHYTAVNGCDSTVVLNLTIELSCPNGTCDVAIYAQDSYGDGWNGNAINIMQNGGVINIYSMEGQGVSNTAIYDTASISVCAGEPISFSWTTGSWASETSFEIANANGVVVYSAAGSDMVGDVTFLTLDSCNASGETPCVTTYGDTTAVACDSFTWYGEAIALSGDYTHTLVNAAGCDSIVTLHLTINSPVSAQVDLTVCDGYAWTDGDGQYYTTSGSYNYTTTGINGCDSTTTLNLTVNYSTSSEFDVTITGETYQWNGETYTESGIYVDTIANVVGCDSIMTLTLTLLPEVSDSVTITFSVNDATMGSISPNGTHVYAVGENVTLTATANEGYHFEGWRLVVAPFIDTVIATNVTTYDFEINELLGGLNAQVIAMFAADPVEPVTVTFTIVVDNPALGTTSPAPGTYSYEVGSTLSLTATPASGCQFVNWTLSSYNGEEIGVVSVEPNVTLDITEAWEGATLIAYFQAVEGIDEVDYTFTVSVTDSRIIVSGAEGRDIYVYDVNGRQMRHMANAADTEEITVPATGVYLVKVDNAPAKRVVVLR